MSVSSSSSGVAPPMFGPGRPPVMTFQLSLMEDMGDDISMVRTKTQSRASAPYRHTSAFLSQLLSVNSRLMIPCAYKLQWI